VVLSSAEHLACVFERITGLTSRLHHVSASSSASTSTLATSGGGETDVGITPLVKDATITIIIIAIASGTLAQRHLSLENRALHVVNENGEVARLVVPEQGAEAVIGGRKGASGSGTGIHAVTRCADGAGVEGTTELEVGEIVVAVVLHADIDQLRPVLDFDGVVLTIGKVGHRRGSREMCIEGVVRLHLAIGREDGDVVVVVTNKLCSVDPPAGYTLLGVVKPEVVPSIEFDCKDLRDGICAVLETTGGSRATTTIYSDRSGSCAGRATRDTQGVLSVRVATEGADHTCLSEGTVVVGVTVGRSTSEYAVVEPVFDLQR